MTDTWSYRDTREWMERVRTGFEPLMISCAVNGGVQGRESNENLPETPAAIAEQVAEAHEAGAVIVHVHPRDRNDLASTARTAEEFHEVNREIRAACPTIIINNTTGASISPNGDTYFEILDALPEMASLNMGPEMTRLRLPERPAHLPHPRPSAIADECLPWTYGRLEELAARMQQRGIKPELETYHPGQFWVTAALADAGLLAEPYVHQFVMGYQTSIFPSPQNLCTMFADLPGKSLAFVAGIGAYQLPMNTLSIIHGSHVRVGLEDNVYYRRGHKLTGNGDAVRRITRLADELQRPVATTVQARSMLTLSPEPRKY
jgi:3-keto-5-aminohexanoate cleavage enzyme